MYKRHRPQHSPETIARTPLDGGLARTTDIARDDQGVGRVFGDGSLLGVLAAGKLTALTDDDALRNLHGWHWSVGGGVSPTFDADRWDDAGVDTAFGALESAGVPLLECLKCLGDAYSFSHVHPAPQRVPFTVDGARRFLAGVTWALTHRGAEGVRAASRDLAPGLTVGDVAEALKALPNERGPRVDYHVLDLLTVSTAPVFRPALPKDVAARSRVPVPSRQGVGPRLAPPPYGLEVAAAAAGG